MYGVVLAAMLSAGGQSTGHWWHHGGHGCWGGYSCHGCQGFVTNYSCHGCWGCNGCSGCYGCYGSSCYGSSCYGSSCYGCYGCSGCYGCYGCSGCYGGSAVHPVVVYGYSCHGCCGGVIVTQNHHVQVVPGANGGGGSAGSKDVTPSSDAEKDAVRRLLKSLREEKESDKEQVSSNVARVTVRVPASARLWVDGVVCPLTSDVRSFDTPPLQAGKNYSYTIRAQFTQDGQVKDESRRVVVAAGRQVDVNFVNTVNTVRR